MYASLLQAAVGMDSKSWTIFTERRLTLTVSPSETFSRLESDIGLYLPGAYLMRSSSLVGCNTLNLLHANEVRYTGVLDILAQKFGASGVFKVTVKDLLCRLLPCGAPRKFKCLKLLSLRHHLALSVKYKLQVSTISNQRTRSRFLT